MQLWSELSTLVFKHGSCDMFTCFNRRFKPPSLVLSHTSVQTQLLREEVERNKYRVGREERERNGEGERGMEKERGKERGRERRKRIK